MPAANYYMLITSLPYHGSLFGADQTPLSRIALDRRLSALTEEDAATLARIERVLEWDAGDMETSDQTFAREATRVVESLPEQKLREILNARLEARMVIAALRRRKRDEPAPSPEERWGYGRWSAHIARNWNDPVFGLGRVYPWLAQMGQFIESGDAIGLERWLLQMAWDGLGRMGDGHYFDFVAVVIYVMRWDLIARWTSYDETAAAERFAGLIDEALGDHVSIFGRGVKNA